MFTYQVEFEHNGVTIVKHFEATNPGGAFMKALQTYPGCKLIRAFRSSIIGRSRFELQYDPPSLAGMKSKPTPKETQEEFGFVK